MTTKISNGVKKYILGIDIGGTNLKGGIVTRHGKVIKAVSIPSDAQQGHEKFLAALHRLITLLGLTQVRAIGIGCPGPLDTKRGIIISPPNIPLKNFPLRAYCARRYHLRTTIDNDANAFVLAEAVYGEGKRYRSVMGLTLGTGVGGGIVIEKRIEHGRGNAGELGFVTLAMDGPRGRAGDVGSLQEYLRGEPMRALRKKLGLGIYSSKAIERLGRRHKRTALQYWKTFGERLGIGIASMVHVLDPDIIVLGGKISKAFPLFRKSLIETVRDRTIFPPPPIRPTKLGDHAGIIGAALFTQQ